MTLERAERQGRVGENIAEGNEDDAGDDEDEDDPEPDEHIDRAIGDAVLRQQQRDFQIHALACRGRGSASRDCHTAQVEVQPRRRGTGSDRREPFGYRPKPATSLALSASPSSSYYGR